MKKNLKKKIPNKDKYTVVFDFCIHKLNQAKDMKQFEDEPEGWKVEQLWRPTDGFARSTGVIRSEMKCTDMFIWMPAMPMHAYNRACSCEYQGKAIAKSAEREDLRACDPDAVLMRPEQHPAAETALCKSAP